MRRTISLLLAVLLLLAAAAVPAASPGGNAFRGEQHHTWPKEPEQTETEPDAETFSSCLPLLLIDTEGQAIPDGEDSGREILCRFFLYDSGGSNTLQDQPAVESRAIVGIRGHSSRWYPKKQYAVKLINKDWSGNDQSLCGMEEGDSYAVNGSYIDRTQIRNYLLYQISDAVMGNAPEARLCEMFLKGEDGTAEHLGLYTIIERIRVDREHLNLTEFNPNRKENAALVQINDIYDHYQIERLMATKTRTHDFDLLYPDFLQMSPEQLRYTKSVLAAYEKSLIDIVAYPESTAWMDRVDVDSFVDYFLINEFFQNYDAGELSTYLYFDLDGIVHIGPVWDFDGAMNNAVDGEVSCSVLGMPESMIFYCLCRSGAFTRLCQLRYRELRETYLSEEYLLSEIDACRAYLGGSLARNYARWYCSDEETRFDRRRGTVEEEYDKLRAYVVERGRRMDENIGKLGMLNG